MNNKIMSQAQAQALAQAVAEAEAQAQAQAEAEAVNFEATELSIPESVLKLPIEKQTDIYNYLIQMTKSQKKAYLIAKDHLGTSFNILKSNGFFEWKNIPLKKV